jgi:hypothetical protein
MAQFEVNYRVFTNNIKEGGPWTQVGPSNYTTVVTAPNQYVAEQMVKSMNGGDQHCYIVMARHMGN